MVCRENKLRSVLMGYEKGMLRAGADDVNYHDHEVQSAIHAVGHVFADADNPTVDEQLAVIEGLKAQIRDDPRFSDAEKYRESDRQPGLITRLDQERRRLETGVDEHGRPLRPEQLNAGRNMAAIKRLGSLLQRGKEAKGAYLETYARSMGISFDDAQRRYDELVTRRMADRMNTRVDLTDGWQDNLAVSGLTTAQQADIGMSNEQREAVRLMESERIAHLATQPRRPTLDPDKKIEFLKSDDPRTQLRCQFCGQFGHDDADLSKCPNLELLSRKWEASDSLEAAGDRYEDARVARQAQLMLEAGPRNIDPNGAVSYYMPGDGSVVGSMVYPDKQTAVEFLRPVAESEPPLNQNDVLRERLAGNDARADELETVYRAQQDLAYVERFAADDETNVMVRGQRGLMSFTSRQAAEEYLRDIGGDIQVTEKMVNELKKADDAAYQNLREAELALDRATGAPAISNAVKSLNYDPDSGLLEVTAHPYTRKRTGEEMPAKSYLYRMSPDEYNKLVSSPSIGAEINKLAWARGTSGYPYKWENDAEAMAATTKVRCPSCQQYAAMTSLHQCPVRGQRSSAEEANWRERLRQQREKERLESLRPLVPETTRRREVRNQSQGVLTHGAMRFPERRAMMGVRERGEVALGGFAGKYLDAQVTGKVYTWKDPGTGEPLVSAANVTCSKCGTPPCRHTGKMLDTIAAQYRATKVAGVTPGGRAFHRDRGAAIDAPTGPTPRLPIEEIRKRRQSGKESVQRTERAHAGARLFATHPLDAQTRQPITNLQQWSGPAGAAPVNLHDGDAVADEITSALRRRGVQHATVRPDQLGGMTIRVDRPSGRRMTPRDRESLAAALGVRRVDSGGVHVPGDVGWSYEFLDRAHGRSPRVLGARIVPDNEQQRWRSENLFPIQ